MRAAIRFAKVAAFSAVVLVAAPSFAQGSPPAQASQNTGDKPPMRQEEIAQVVAGIALYPDDLLSQILMASTYPLEIVEADRWAKANASLKDDALATALEKQTWDPSVKSLVNFPDVLSMMSEKLDWTVKLGDAFISQQAEVMSTIQSLRAKAKTQGNLKSNDKQNVTTEAPAPAEGGGGSTTEVIVIESASPSTVYVPTYDPTVVYGAWAYPGYAPYWYARPGYVAGAAALSFGLGVARGAAWGYAWGHANWGHGHGHGHVDVNVNRNTNFNRNIDRSRQTNASGRFQHNSAHRGGAPYRDRATSERFGRSSSSRATQSRESFRGRADQGRRDLSSGGGGDRSGVSDRGGDRGSRGGERGDRARSTGRPSGSSASSGSGRGQQRSRSSSGGSGAFNSVNSGSSARASSNRGNSSRASSGSSRSSGARSSGGSRGGGGRGGGGRR